MASIIEKSLQEYQDFLDGKNTGVEIVEAEIPVKPGFPANINLKKAEDQHCLKC